MGFDLSKIRKAIAGGVAAAVGGSGTAFLIVPPGLNIPTYVYAAIPIINFAIGFGVVYFAPANSVELTDKIVAAAVADPKSPVTTGGIALAVQQAPKT